VQAIEELGHLAGLLRNAVVRDRLAEILDAEGQVCVVGWELIALCEIHKAADAGLQQAPQARPGRRRGGPAGMLTGEQLAREHPVAVGQRERSGRGLRGGVHPRLSSGRCRECGEGRERFLILLTHRRDPAGVEADEVEAPGVGQVRGLDVAQR
jgi:hypothetical protein